MITCTANQRTCRLRLRPIALAAAIVLAGCTGGDELADAYGNFEATEVLASAGATGRIMRLDVTEGQTVAARRKPGSRQAHETSRRQRGHTEATGRRRWPDRRVGSADRSHPNATLNDPC